MKIAIAGTGYVGLSNGILLSQHNEVIDIIPEKVDMLNKGVSPIEDKEYLTMKTKVDKEEAYKDADYLYSNRL